MGKAPHNDIIETKFENSKEKIFFKGSNGDNKKFRKQFLTVSQIAERISISVTFASIHCKFKY